MTTRLILEYVERELGPAGVRQLLALANIKETEEELRDENRWFTYELKHQLFDAASALLNDPHAPYHIGQHVLEFRAGTPLKLALRAFGSPKLVYQNVVTAAGKMTTVHSTEIVEITNESARVRFKDTKGVGIRKADREYNSGLLSCVPALFGMPLAKVRLIGYVEEPQAACEYEVTWDSPRKSLSNGVFVGVVAGVGLALVTALMSWSEWLFVAAAFGPVVGGVVNSMIGRRRWRKQLWQQLHGRLEAQDERQRQLASSMQDLVSELKIDEVLSKITRYAQAAVGGKQYALVLDIGGEHYATSHSSDLPASAIETLESFVASIAGEEQSQPLLIDEVAETPALAALAEDLRMPIGSLCLAPLQYKSARLGYLVALSDHTQGFLPTDIDLLELYAAQAAVALANAKVLAQLEQRASTDPLTGLRNHREFHEKLASEVDRCTRSDTRLTLMMMDLDLFKAVNDELGHREGDRVLRLVGECIMRAAPDPERAFRIGGDEFALIIKDADSLEARKIAEELSESLPPSEPQISISFGIAEWPDDAHSKESLIKTADLALNRAKQETAEQSPSVDTEAGAGYPALESRYKEAGELERLELGKLSLQKQRRQLALANRLGSKLGRMVDPDEICETVVEELHREFHYYMASVKTLDHKRDGLVNVAGAGLVYERLRSAGQPLRQPVTRGVIGRVVRTAEAACVNDVRLDPDFIGSDFNVESRSELCAPIRVGNRVWGALNLEEPQVAAFDADDVALVNTVADQMGSVLQSAKLYEELENAYVATVEALSGALEAKDRYTASHARRIAETSVAVGRCLGLSENELKTLRYAALFHDIGKLGIPTEILNKDSKLDSTEFEQVAEHTVIGEQILEPVPFLDEVTPLVRHAHERWDGTGYPDGLKGDEIPLGARIIFVCDAYHAMTSNRPYRKAMGRKAALDELRAGAGSQFDPVVVDAFLDLIEERESESSEHPVVATAGK